MRRFVEAQMLSRDILHLVKRNEWLALCRRDVSADRVRKCRRILMWSFATRHPNLNATCLSRFLPAPRSTCTHQLSRENVADRISPALDTHVCFLFSFIKKIQLPNVRLGNSTAMIIAHARDTWSTSWRKIDKECFSGFRERIYANLNDIL